MNARAYGQALFALLGFGTVDLVALNAWAVPSLLAVDVARPAAPAPKAVRAPNRAAAHGGGEGAGASAPETNFNAATQPPAAPEPVNSRLRVAEPVNSTPRANVRTPSPSRGALLEPAPNLQRDPALLLFHKGTWWVGPASRRELRGAFEHVQQSSLVELEGHADATGPSDVNQRISENRAVAVEALLVNAGIEPERIRIRAFGETHASGTALDRRVEIWIER
jgi:outer membrane protein OmpA-like peptidoglycan-associated protein